MLSLNELKECGFSRRQVGLSVEAGWLHPIHRGVYVVGHPAVCLEGRFLAAVKASGDAFLSHYAAAALWKFVHWDGRHPEVTVPRMGVPRRNGIRGSLHFSGGPARCHAPQRESGHRTRPDTR